MPIDLHHVHIFASDIEATVAWWARHLDAQVILDHELAGVAPVPLDRAIRSSTLAGRRR